CYLPVMDPLDRDTLLACHARWLSIASEWISDGKIYAETLKMRRLRAATVLPAWLADETLQAMREASWEELRRRVKVPRSRVYLLLVKSLSR
ncbi:MAG TPA: hypothetical protein VIM57_01370, partial [Luteolibacter sp.]